MYGVLLASIIPGLFWMWYFYRRDRYEKEPIGQLIKALIAGALGVLPALLIEYPFQAILSEPTDLGTIFLVSFLVIGLGEELSKFLALYLVIYKSPEFNEPVDGIIYGIMVAIGFSIVENIMYISAFGLEIAPLRAIIATLAHTAFTGLLGYFVGLSKFTNKRVPNLVYGIFIAVFLHGLYDFLLIGQLVSPFVVVMIVVILHFVLLQAIEHALQRSPFA